MDSARLPALGMSVELKEGKTMISFEIPGSGPVEIEHVLLDYNGTIAVDGAIAPGAADIISELAKLVHVVVLTADTYGTAKAQCEPLGVEVRTFPRENAAAFKEEYVASLAGGVAAFGNGRNDIGMLDKAALSIAILDVEGACAALLPHADIVARDICEGLALLLHVDRIRATLRG